MQESYGLIYLHCHSCKEEGCDYTEEHIGDVLDVEPKVVPEERVYQGLNHGKPKIDDEESNHKVHNGLH